MAPAAGAYHPARLASLEDAGGGMTLVRVEASAEVVSSYTTPGQFVEVRVDGETGYFVLAGLPAARPWELVMRRGGGASDVLLAAVPGRALEITAAIGAGFPMDVVRGRAVVLALGGTGIAAGRPLVARRVADGDAPRTHVFVGARTREELALAGDLDAWRAAGVPVVVCLSQGGRGTEGFAPGYVQDVIRERVPAAAWADAHVFAVGMTSMVDALRAMARSQAIGLPPERVLTNH